jgi:CheY-like chemotaxis protein/rhodanese-related sulfurtransferase
MTKILIADDNSLNLYLLESILKGYGYDEVSSATNGAEALDAARQDIPDLIISDIFMPVMDGFALCMEWKGDERLKKIPFIFYTATYTNPKDEQFALSLGAERFLIKPQDPETLIRVVREVLAESVSETSAKAGLKEVDALQQYSEVLFRKLEQKAAQLEKAEADLKEIPSAIISESRVSVFDFLMILGVSILVAIMFNISNPNGIPLFPVWPNSDSIPSISAHAAMEELRGGQTLMVDAMPPNFFQKQHIKSAINMPLAIFDIVYLINFSEENRDRKIIVYGNTISRPYAFEIADKLLLRGFTGVRCLKGDLHEWKANGFPVEEDISE